MGSDPPKKSQFVFQICLPFSQWRKPKKMTHSSLLHNSSNTELFSKLRYNEQKFRVSSRTVHKKILDGYHTVNISQFCNLLLPLSLGTPLKHVTLCLIFTSMARLLLRQFALCVYT